MINLEDYTVTIEEFVKTSIDKFLAEQDKINSIGVYCCPWSGWISMCFNVENTIENTHTNCPDFEFVEFDFLELVGWQEEYESDSATFVFKTKKLLGHDGGDEALNELVFGFLKPIVLKVKEDYSYEFLLQFLDSKFVEVV